MIKINVNNGQAVELIQEQTGGPIKYTLRDNDGETVQGCNIPEHEIISFLNDYIYKVETDHKREPTGLKDRMGREICEGDILQSSNQVHKVIFDGNQIEIPFITEIISEKYKGKLFALSAQIGYKKKGYYYADHILVIGSIYD